MLPRVVLVFALVSSLVGCTKEQGEAVGPGGGKMCTQIGCVDGLRLTLEKAGAWAPGAYTFAFTLDGAAVTCSGSLPLKACDAGPSLTCDAEGRVMIGESGCALPPDQHGWSDIQVSGAPKAVKLTISRDGQPLHAAELTPTYTESRPNGPDCGPVCRGAAATIAVP